MMPALASSQEHSAQMWALDLGGHRWSAALGCIAHTQRWECRVYRDGALFYSRRFELQEQAVDEADEMRTLVEREWQLQAIA